MTMSDHAPGISNLTGQISVQTQKWLTNEQMSLGEEAMDLVIRAFSLSMTKPPTAEDRSLLLKSSSGLFNNANKVSNSIKMTRMLVTASAFISAHNPVAGKTGCTLDKDLAEFFIVFMRCTAQLAQKFRVDKDFHVEALRNLMQSLAVCVGHDFVFNIKHTAFLPSDKLQGLLMYLTDSCWVFVLRGMELFCGTTGEAAMATGEGYQAFRELHDLRLALLTMHLEHPETSLAKGLEASTRSLLLTTKLVGKTAFQLSDIDRLVTAWDAILHDTQSQRVLTVTVGEVQRMVHWVMECQTILPSLVPSKVMKKGGGNHSTSSDLPSSHLDEGSDDKDIWTMMMSKSRRQLHHVLAFIDSMKISSKNHSNSSMMLLLDLVYVLIRMEECLCDSSSSNNSNSSSSSSSNNSSSSSSSGSSSSRKTSGSNVITNSSGDDDQLLIARLVLICRQVQLSDLLSDGVTLELLSKIPVMAVRMKLKQLASTRGSNSGGGDSIIGGGGRRVESAVATPSNNNNNNNNNSSSTLIGSMLEALWCSISTSLYQEASPTSTTISSSASTNNSTTTAPPHDARAKAAILLSKSFSAPFLTLHKQLVQLLQPSTKLGKTINGVEGVGHRGDENICVVDVVMAIGDVTISVLHLLNSICGNVSDSSNESGSSSDSGIASGIGGGTDCSSSSGGTNSLGSPIVSSLTSILRAMGNCLSATPATTTTATNTTNNSGGVFARPINTHHPSTQSVPPH